MVGLFSQTLKSAWQDEFPPRIFKELADEIIRAISTLFLRTQRYLQYNRLNLKNDKCGIPMEEEELDSYRETAEQLMIGFHCTEDKEQQAGFITKMYQVNLISSCRQVTCFIKIK